MPELPEVQTIVSDLKKKIIGRKIVGAWFDAPKLIKKPKPAEFCKKIKRLKIKNIQRRGKNILIYLIQNSKANPPTRQLAGGQNYNSKLKNNFILLIHQKLTGHLLLGKWKVKKVHRSKFIVQSLIKGALEEKVNNYIHLIFYLDDGWQLALSDLRKFAKILFGPKEEIEKSPELAELGPEPLDKNLTFQKFKDLINLKKGKIKQVLIDQKIIAGIGNIYSDEILWQAKIHPLQRADQLKTNQFKAIYLAMRQILKKAVKLRGTSISDYRDASGKSGAYAKIRKTYQREGEPCPRCGALIKRIKIGGRSAHFCPKCQKL